MYIKHINKLSKLKSAISCCKVRWVVIPHGGGGGPRLGRTGNSGSMTLTPWRWGHKGPTVPVNNWLVSIYQKRICWLGFWGWLLLCEGGGAVVDVHPGQMLTTWAVCDQCAGPPCCYTSGVKILIIGPGWPCQGKTPSSAELLPSLWGANSPLVIPPTQSSSVPVIKTWPLNGLAWLPCKPNHGAVTEPHTEHDTTHASLHPRFLGQGREAVHKSPYPLAACVRVCVCLSGDENRTVNIGPSL